MKLILRLLSTVGLVLLLAACDEKGQPNTPDEVFWFGLVATIIATGLVAIVIILVWGVTRL